MNFHDANIRIGLPLCSSLAQPLADVDEVAQALHEHSGKSALLWHCTQIDDSPLVGNAMLAEAIRQSDCFWGSWTLLPPQTDGLVTADFFQRMKSNRIVALRAFPDIHRYLLCKTVFGQFLEEAVERSIPLLLSMTKGCTWPTVYRLLEEYPALHCVLCDIGIWSMDRYTYPLLENFSNVYLESSLLSLEEGGLENVVRRYGAQRIIFGSGLPDRYVEAALLQLKHAEISDDDRQQIATSNFERVFLENPILD